MAEKIKAYVIMPYGGEDENLKKEFSNIFRFIIQSALLSYNADVQPIRQDFTGDGGLIINNIINNLGMDDLVIADISMLNWNVAYELGIRHSLSKSHTVLLCNDETDIPFDIRSLNIIRYSRKDWMSQIDDIETRLVQAINNTMQTNRCDSPVHSCFTALPEKLTEMLSNTNDAEQNRISELVTQNQQLTAEIEQLKSRLEAAGLDITSSNNTNNNLAELFVEAVKNKDLISDTAVDHLRELADEKKYEEFARFLANVLEHGYLDEVDCRNVYIICRRLGIPEITKQYIQVVVSFYPDNEELQGFLASEYSSDYRERERAQLIANDMLGLKRIGGKYELISKVRSERMIMSFFDVYFTLKKYQEIIEIGFLLNKSLSYKHPVIARYICRAALKLEQYDLSYSAISYALHNDPLSGASHRTMYLYHDSRNEELSAYADLENALCCNPDSIDAHYEIAGHICDELCARTEQGRIERISAREKEKYVLPFILRAFCLDQTTIERAISFLKKNKLTESCNNLISVYNGKVSIDDVFAEICMTSVYYCYDKQEELLVSVDALPSDFQEKFLNID